ncbi:MULTISPECIES: hypothetical protein [unclassified Microcoleus]|uniref:hypothetical protein n=1 Tax=unclassified Microcoleus TaxID=2642155 RepID=UPI0025E2D5D5|nr:MULTISPECIES: hypothetical protein [unclassified Microcoleus]
MGSPRRLWGHGIRLWAGSIAIGLPVSNEKRLLVQRTNSSTKPPSGRRKINVTGKSSAEDWQDLPLTLHSYSDVLDTDAMHTVRASRFIRRCLYYPKIVLVLHRVQRF